MNTLLHLLLALGLAASAQCFFLNPSVLEPKINTQNICYDIENENAVPAVPSNYITCANNAIIKVQTAYQVVSNPVTCPIQYNQNHPGAPLVVPAQCVPNTLTNSNVTRFLQEKCDKQVSCAFTFNSIFPKLRCILEDANPAVSSAVGPGVALQVQLVCEPIRRRFRPFSNKRYDPKFSRSFAHPAKSISFNNAKALGL